METKTSQIQLASFEAQTSHSPPIVLEVRTMSSFRHIVQRSPVLYLAQGDTEKTAESLANLAEAARSRGQPPGQSTDSKQRSNLRFFWNQPGLVQRSEYMSPTSLQTAPGGHLSHLKLVNPSDLTGVGDVVGEEVGAELGALGEVGDAVVGADGAAVGTPVGRAVGLLVGYVGDNDVPVMVGEEDRTVEGDVVGEDVGVVVARLAVGAGAGSMTWA
mmetsp:Transcript_23045/g.32518  ORF Transcript_23045/g.32518 Transcript_23045/m.32518 type:complete len:216 (-) Transcript_23045:291-938(-)